ncbi:MAG: type II toxin-antitoxin system VapC family toxin [Candidatus Binatia bacterium]
MTVLLDTHCWLWWIAAPAKLNESVQALIADHQNNLYLSAASVDEVRIIQAAR